MGCNATHNEDPAYFDYPWYCTLPYGHGGGTHKAGDSTDHRKFYFEWADVPQ